MGIITKNGKEIIIGTPKKEAPKKIEEKKEAPKKERMPEPEIPEMKEAVEE